MRLKKTVVDLNYNETKTFFNKRAKKYNEDSPYTVTMYQDNHIELAMEMNHKEKSILYSKLELAENSKVLDIACGIGRWADAIIDKIDRYLGVDFSGELIKIANARNSKSNFKFLEGNLKDIESIASGEKFNVIIMVGILMYLNDEDLLTILNAISNVCDESALVCIREPIAKEERLTLKNFYSNELMDNYNAIYRSHEELMKSLEKTFLNKGFEVKEEAYLFAEEKLNNRTETAKYYFILKR